MTREDLRLECLRLANRADRRTTEVITMAKDYENYVLESSKPVSIEGKKKAISNESKSHDIHDDPLS